MVQRIWQKVPSMAGLRNKKCRDTKNSEEKYINEKNIINRIGRNGSAFIGFCKACKNYF